VGNPESVIVVSGVNDLFGFVNRVASPPQTQELSVLEARHRARHPPTAELAAWIGASTSAFSERSDLERFH
jgi:hypothetical protein